MSLVPGTRAGGTTLGSLRALECTAWHFGGSTGHRSYPGGRTGQGQQIAMWVLLWSSAHWGLTTSQAVAEDGNLNLVVRELGHFQDGGFLGNLPAGGSERVRHLFEITQL